MRRKRHGFTVLECLIVVAILAGQWAILMPAIESAREKNRNTTCQNNLKDCGFAFCLYWNDYDSTLPSSVLASDNPKVTPPTQQQVVSFMTSTGGKWPPRRYSTEPAKTWPRILRSHMRSANIIFCPSDIPDQRTSYWWKYSVDLAWRDESIEAKRESSYAFHADQIILYEHAGWHTGDAAGVKDGIKINVAFMDTHVASITVTNGPVNYPPASDECSGQSSARFGEPMYYNFDTVSNSGCSGPAAYIDPRKYCDKF